MDSVDRMHQRRAEQMRMAREVGEPDLVSDLVRGWALECYCCGGVGDLSHCYVVNWYSNRFQWVSRLHHQCPEVFVPSVWALLASFVSLEGESVAWMRVMV